MRVCWFGAYDPAYPRNAILRRGVRQAGWDVVECRVDPDASLAAQSRRLVAAFGRLSSCDVMVTAEFNQFHVPLAAALARRWRAPLVVDFLISLWDTAVEDRRLLRPYRPRALSRYAQDTTALRLADAVVVDSAPLIEHYVALFGSPADKAHVVPVGAPDWLFGGASPSQDDDRGIRVLYYGNYIPLHGLEYVCDAAEALRDDGRLEWTFVGTGQSHDVLRRRLSAALGDRVRFIERLPFAELVDQIHGADICLGAFGTSEKARRVVPNKVWQALAAGRAVVTGGGPGSRAVLRHDEHALLVPHGDGAVIAEAIDRLAGDPALRRRIAAAGSRIVHERFSSAMLGQRMVGVFDTVRERTPAAAGTHASLARRLDRRSRTT